MKTRTYLLLLFLMNTLAINAQERTFVYPFIPDSLQTIEERANFLGEHYWDNFDFKDTLQLNDPNLAEQGFVNFIDLLPRLPQELAKQSIAAFASHAFAYPAAKSKMERLIEHYFDDPDSPLRDDRTYLLFLEEMGKSPYFDETEKERLTFKRTNANKNLPGDIATDFTFKDQEGKSHRLRDYKERKVILYFYDPECENCHRVSRWLNKQVIPSEVMRLDVEANTQLYHLYSLRAMPTIYLLDKGNQVVLKDCSPEKLLAKLHDAIQ